VLKTISILKLARMPPAPPPRTEEGRDFLGPVTQGGPSVNRADPGLNAAIPLGLGEGAPAGLQAPKAGGSFQCLDQGPHTFALEIGDLAALNWTDLRLGMKKLESRAARSVGTNDNSGFAKAGRRASASLRWFLSLLLLILVLGGVGCIPVGIGFPIGKENLMGPSYSKDALAFLDLPGATREEAISTLGPPTLELRDLQILAYVCQSGTKWWSAVGYADLTSNEIKIIESGQSVDNNQPLRALLVAYDQRGMVSAHKVCRLGEGSLEGVCLEWSRSLVSGQSRK